jgi:hypothetical protein
VSDTGLARLTHDDLLAQLADLFLRGRGAASAGSFEYSPELIGEARALLTRPFLLATLVRAGSLEWSRVDPSHVDATASPTAALFNEGVLQLLAAWSGTDASSARTLFGSATSTDPAAVVRADATLYVALADALLGSFDRGMFSDQKAALGGLVGIVEALADPLARSGIDPSQLRIGLQLAQTHLDAGDAAGARARASAARSAIASLITSGGR